MNKPNNILFVALLISITPSSLLHAPFFDVDAFEEIEQHIEQSLRHMRKQFKPFTRQPLFATPISQNISLDSNDTTVTITIHEIEMDNLEARLNDANNQLSITTPNKKFIIATRDTIIGIQAQETMHQTNKNVKDTKEAIAQFSGTSVYRTETSVHGKLLLEKQTTDYDPAKKELIIRIPVQQATKGKIVPINTITPLISINEMTDKSEPEKVVTKENPDEASK